MSAAAADHERRPPPPRAPYLPVVRRAPPQRPCEERATLFPQRRAAPAPPGWPAAAAGRSNELRVALLPAAGGRFSEGRSTIVLPDGRATRAPDRSIRCARGGNRQLSGGGTGYARTKPVTTTGWTRRPTKTHAIHSHPCLCTGGSMSCSRLLSSDPTETGARQICEGRHRGAGQAEIGRKLQQTDCSLEESGHAR